MQNALGSGGHLAVSLKEIFSIVRRPRLGIGMQPCKCNFHHVDNTLCCSFFRGLEITVAPYCAKKSTLCVHFAMNKISCFAESIPRASWGEKKARNKREIGAISFSFEWRKMKSMMRGYLIAVANIRQGKIIEFMLS